MALQKQYSKIREFCSGFFGPIRDQVRFPLATLPTCGQGVQVGGELRPGPLPYFPDQPQRGKFLGVETFQLLGLRDSVYQNIFLTSTKTFWALAYFWFLFNCIPYPII